ncbi:MAG: hypothetical protein ACAH83_01450 [Alphaproteobacteria bacterium]
MTEKSKDNKGKGGKGKAPVSDKDAIDTLPLSMIPLTSNTLKSARLIKNSRLETAVELHNDPISGSLQIRPEDVADSFPGAVGDQEIIASLSKLHSYDVYSLRTSLKKLGIKVDNTVLELSDNMKDRLDQYAVEFTRPLILNIFGTGATDLNDQGGLVKIFRDPDRVRVAQRLRLMAQKTGIPVEELPKFLENYNDVFLSVAYYRHSFEIVVPDINRFWLWLGDLRGKREVASSARTSASCRKVEESLRFLSGSIRERLGRFRGSFESFWGDMNPQSFEKLRREIEDNHVGMGAVLCGLVVKMHNWSQAFPDNEVGGPATRAQYLVSEMEPGLEHLKEMENDARARIGLTLVHIF